MVFDVPVHPPEEELHERVQRDRPRVLSEVRDLARQPAVLAGPDEVREPVGEEAVEVHDEDEDGLPEVMAAAKTAAWKVTMRRLNHIDLRASSGWSANTADSHSWLRTSSDNPQR